VSPGFYTAWHYRRFLLDKLEVDLKEELSYLTQVAMKHPKNYQIWYYRRELLNRLNNPSVELKFVKTILEIDEKNVHAWGYRQWVIQKFNLWTEELSYIEGLLEKDPRNNSAWNQRNFVVSNTKDIHSQATKLQELEFAFKYAKENPNNESAWNYARSFFSPDVAKPTKQQVMQIIQQKGYTRYLLQFLAFVYQKENKGEVERGICLKLQALDPIRKSYWRWRATAPEKNPGRDEVDLKLLPQLFPKPPGITVMALYYSSKN